MMGRWCICVLLAVMAFLCEGTGDSEESGALLLASKNILNQLVVEGKDLTVEYSVYNIGTSSAVDVELTDTTFPDSDFKVTNGYLSVKWSRIAPSSNVSHVVILQPQRSGYFNFTSAEISYLPSEEAKDRKTGYTSAPGEGPIMNFKDYDRKFSPHVLDWAAFALMTLPSLGIPFLLWFQSKSKYDQPKTVKKN